MCLLHVDGVLIEKLLVNLLENAAVHTPGGTSMHLNADLQGDTLTVKFRDHGPGLPPGSEELLFEKFERGVRTSSSSGSGLGLSICRAIADLHGLTITARNHPGGGAEFSVSFPIPCTPEPRALHDE
jgi:two-component system sensor histidine kinase KdpD